MLDRNLAGRHVTMRVARQLRVYEPMDIRYSLAMVSTISDTLCIAFASAVEV